MLYVKVEWPHSQPFIGIKDVSTNESSTAFVPYHIYYEWYQQNVRPNIMTIEALNKVDY